MLEPQKPVGLNPISILYIIGDSIYIIGGIVLFIGVPLLGNDNLFHIVSNSFAYELLSSEFGIPVAIGLTTLGILNVSTSIALLTNKKWAWKSNVILAIISASVDIIILVLQANTSSFISAILGLGIDSTLVYYLYKPNVKFYFRV
jgi:hypothetical protein